MGLGDVVERALSSVGITKDRVEAWLGRPCGCAERQERLNALGYWAKRVVVAAIRGGNWRRIAAEEFEEITKCNGR